MSINDEELDIDTSLNKNATLAKCISNLCKN